MEEHASFGYWIQRRRKALDLTQHELARRVGCAVSTIRKIEADERRPSRQMAELLANKLAIPDTERATFLEVARAERSIERLGAIAQPLVAPIPLRPAQPTTSDETGTSAAVGQPLNAAPPQRIARPAAPTLTFGAELEADIAKTAPLPEADTIPLSSYALSRFRRNRLKMLEKVNNWWVKGVLEKSLHGAALIELGIRYEPEAVSHPWGMVLMEPNYGEYILPAGLNIIQVFDQLGEELLILGEPGAGKTTMLLELTRDLVARAQHDETHPIPIIFNLSSWSTKQSIADWLIDELSTKYQVPRRIGRAWVQAGGVLLPLLDGLDEVRASEREACVDAINIFRRDYGLDGIAICSRTAEYRMLTTRLQLQGAVQIQPLTTDQIRAYLANLPATLTHLPDLIEAHPALQELVQSPLMLTIMTLAYQESSAQTATTLDIQQQQAQLLATYVEQMIKRRYVAHHYPSSQIVHWLGWVANNLVQHDQNVFLIERMRPSWFPTAGYQRLYRFCEGAGVGVIAGIGTALVYGLRTFLPNTPHQGIGQAVLGYNEFSTWMAQHTSLALAPVLWLLMLCALGTAAGILSGVGAGMIALPIPIATLPLLHRLAPETHRAIRDFIHMGLATGTTAALVSWLFVGAAGSFFEFVGVGVISGIAAILASQPGRLAVVETLGWSWRRALLGLVISSFIALTWFLTNQMLNAWGATVYRAGERVVVYTIALGLAAGITSGEIEIKARANQGIWRSAKNATIIGLIAWLIVGTIGGVIDTTITNPVLRLISGVEFGLGAGIVMALGWGGFVCLQHILLRFILWRSGCIPRDYVEFLDAAVDSLLLRQVGGGYIFIHRLIMEHFTKN